MLNTCVMSAVIFISLIFENLKDTIRHIKVTLQPYSYRKACITDERAAEPKGVYFNWEAFDYEPYTANGFKVNKLGDYPIELEIKPEE